MGAVARLRSWDVADARWYVEARDDVVFQFTTEDRELTVGEAQDAIRRALDDSELAVFAITDEFGKIVGNVALRFMGDAAEISYFLTPAGRGYGLATDAVRLAATWAIERRRRPRSGSGGSREHGVRGRPSAQRVRAHWRG